MTKSLIIYGPQGCGKTRNAEVLRKFFQLDKVVELEAPLGIMPKEGRLFLTNQTPPHHLDIDAMAFDTAMAMVNAARRVHIKTIGHMKKDIHPIERFAADRWKDQS